MSQIKPTEKFCFGECQAWLKVEDFKNTNKNCCKKCTAKIKLRRRESLKLERKSAFNEQQVCKKLSRQHEIKKIAQQIDNPQPKLKRTNSKKLVEACGTYAEMQLQKEIDDMIGDRL